MTKEMPTTMLNLIQILTPILPALQFGYYHSRFTEKKGKAKKAYNNQCLNSLMAEVVFKPKPTVDSTYRTF